ncbi:MAG: L,D-transpeptidase family protein [Chthoniobacteraceae bacterium]
MRFFLFHTVRRLLSLGSEVGGELRALAGIAAAVLFALTVCCRAQEAADGVTPLMKAVAAADYGEIQHQLDLGAEVNRKDAQGRTALFYALEARSPRVVDWLIGKGADPDLTDGQGVPLLDRAFKTGDLALFKPLLWARAPRKWSATTLRELDAALGAANKPLISTLLAAHSGPPMAEGARQSRLAYLVTQGKSEALGLLLEGGANPDWTLNAPVEKAFAQTVRNRDLRESLERERGITLLMLAVAEGQLECAKVLMDHNARTDLQTAQRKLTAMYFAVEGKASPEMFQVLLGKNPEEEDHKVRVEISVKKQQAVVYKNGLPALEVPVSTGKPGFETPMGRFVVTDKDTMRMSTIYTFACMPFFMRLSGSEYGIHAGEVPKNQAASHGCIRVPLESAKGLYDEVELGTLVTISQ